jgi:hypothetical protein
VRRLLLFGVLIAAGACGSSTSNSGPSGMNAQVGFTWLGTVTQTTAGPNGAVCLLSFQGANGTADSWTIQMTQNDTAVTAVAVSNNSGQTCNYTGTVGPSALTLNMTACSPPGFPLTCGDAYLATRTLSGTVNGTVIQGTTAESWNVYATGDTTTILSTITTTGNFIFRR